MGDAALCTECGRPYEAAGEDDHAKAIRVRDVVLDALRVRLHMELNELVAFERSNAIAMVLMEAFPELRGGSQ